MQIRAHSPRTFSSPRKRSMRNPRACLICPNTGSTMNFRVTPTAAPTWVASFRSIRSTRLAPFDHGSPGLQGSRRSRLCFCFPVATNPLIFLLFRYFRFSSEQYPLSATTSFGFCPDCSSYPLQQQHQLLFIIRSLRDLLPYDQLKDRFDGDLRVVALRESIRPFQNAGLPDR